MQGEEEEAQVEEDLRSVHFDCKKQQTLEVDIER